MPKKKSLAEHKAALAKDQQKAQKARLKGKWREAISAYERMLEREPGRADVRVRIAELYAKYGANEAAIASYQAAADAYLHFGEREKALSVYVAGARALGGNAHMWERAADLELERGHRGDALRHLLEGGRTLLRVKMARPAVRLLRRAFSLEPFQPDVALALGDALIGSGRRDEARTLWLRIGLEARRRDVVRRARRALALHFPTPVNLWRYVIS